MNRIAFINLPARDLDRSTEFLAALGLTVDPAVGDDRTRCVHLGDGAAVMLHTEAYFAEFTGSAVADTTTTREVAVGLSAASRDEVDTLTGIAVAAGGEAVGVQDLGFLYIRAFRDLDGHQWSLIHMEG